MEKISLSRENYIIINGNKYNNWQDWCYNVVPSQKYYRLISKAKSLDMLGQNLELISNKIDSDILCRYNNKIRKYKVMDRFRNFIIKTLLEEVNVDITEVIWNDINLNLIYKKQ